MFRLQLYISFFFFNDTATTEIYTLSLHDALPICLITPSLEEMQYVAGEMHKDDYFRIDRKSTRLNSSHQIISYAVFCLKKKKTTLPIESSSGIFDKLMNEFTQIEDPTCRA